MQCAAGLAVLALSFVLSAHEAHKLDAFVGLAAVLATVLFAKLAQTRVAPSSFEWAPLLGLTAVAGAVTFALSYYLGPVAAHRSRDGGWVAVSAGLAFFELVVTLRMLTAARAGRV
jgi:hypothetical protein